MNYLKITPSGSLGLMALAWVALAGSPTTALAQGLPVPIDPIPVCEEDPCRMAIGGDVFCADPDTFCNDVSDAYLDSFPTPHPWTDADLDILIASIREGDVDGDISEAAYQELRDVIEGGGAIEDVTAWMDTYFDQGAGLAEAGGAGDRITAAACRQVCRRIPGTLPSQCRKLCRKLARATKTTMMSLCNRLTGSQKTLCLQVAGAFCTKNAPGEVPQGIIGDESGLPLLELPLAERQTP